MGIQIAFNYPQWLSLFPELAYISAGASFTGVIAGSTLTASAVTFGSLAVGQVLTDTTGMLLPNTVVLQSLSPTTWTVSNSQTVASEPMSTTGVVQASFARAEGLQDNTGIGPPVDIPTQTLTMYLLTAHISVLNTNLANGAPASTIVGRISDASQGSVHVAAQFDVPAGSAQWYAQTRYGAEYWTETSIFRRFRHFPALGRVAAFAGPGVGPGGRVWGSGLGNGGFGPWTGR